MRAFPLRVCCLLVLLFGASCRGAAMDTAEAFPNDPRAAELAGAAGEGDTARVRQLVRAGADPNARGDRGVTPLQFAMLAQDLDGMRALLAAGADPNLPGLGGATPMHMAAIADDPKYLRLLLDHGGDPNARHGETGAGPLAGATGPRTDAQFRMLLDAGADPNLADRTGNTPLHAAAMINAGEHVLLLLDKGASANAKNAQGATFQPYFFKTEDRLLNARARAHRGQVVAWLRDHGVPVEAAAAR
jgi:ankyrin repeat protein